MHSATTKKNRNARLSEI